MGKFLKLIAVFTLSTTCVAMAQERRGYPVVDAVQGLPHPELVTAYPDSEDKNLFYFLPTTVAFAKEGRTPRFGVQHWGITGPDPDGVGAGLTFSIRPAFDRETIQRVEADIRRKNPNARFAFPSLISSKMRILIVGAYHDTKQDTNLPDNTIGGPVDGTSAFAISLSRIGARAFSQDVSADSDVLGAEYTYKFIGIAKRLHARVTVFQKRTYEHFALRAKANAWWGLAKTDWQADYQKLRENGHIKMEILEGGTTDHSEYLLELFKTLANAKVSGEGMFKPELRPAGLQASAESMKAGWGFSSSVAWERLSEDKTFVFEIQTARLEEREFKVGLSFSAVCARYPTHFVDLTTPKNRCINPAQIKETARAARRCLERKLTWLKKLLDDRLIPESVYLRKVESALDDPCYDGEAIVPSSFVMIEDKLKELAKQRDDGLFTSGQWRARVTQLSMLPYFDRQISDEARAALTSQQKFTP